MPALKLADSPCGKNAIQSIPDSETLRVTLRVCNLGIKQAYGKTSSFQHFHIAPVAWNLEPISLGMFAAIVLAGEAIYSR